METGKYDHRAELGRRRQMPMEERFHSMVSKGLTSECWRWNGASDQDGYGMFWTEKGRCTRAHRFAMELHLGRRIRGGMCVLHSCNNKGCCNPAHLREGTHQENMQDILRSPEGHYNSRKTHCPRGHPLVRAPNGRQRICIPCRRAMDRIRKSVYRQRVALATLTSSRTAPLPHAVR